MIGIIEFDNNGDLFEVSYDIVNFKSIGNGFLDVFVGWWVWKISFRFYLNFLNIIWNSLCGYNGVLLLVCLFDCKLGEWRVIKFFCCWECVNCFCGIINFNGFFFNCFECFER